MTLKIAGGLAGCGLLLAGIFFSLAGKENEQPPKEASLIQSISGTGIIRGVLRGLSRQRRQRRRSYGEVAQGCAARSDACCGAEWREFPLPRIQRIISGEEPGTAGHGTRAMPVWGPIFSQFAWDQDLGKIRVYNLAKRIEEMQVK